MGHAAEDMDTKAFRVQIGEWGAQPEGGRGAQKEWLLSVFAYLWQGAGTV